MQFAIHATKMPCTKCNEKYFKHAHTHTHLQVHTHLLDQETHFSLPKWNGTKRKPKNHKKAKHREQFDGRLNFAFHLFVDRIEWMLTNLGPIFNTHFICFKPIAIPIWAIYSLEIYEADNQTKQNKTTQAETKQK